MTVTVYFYDQQWIQAEVSSADAGIAMAGPILGTMSERFNGAGVELLLVCKLEGDEQECEWLRNGFRMELAQLSNCCEDGLRGIENSIKNLQNLCFAPSVREIEPLDCDAICVGAGPGLRHHIDEIRQLQDRCLIVSCDVALEGLLAEGITPHIVTPLERVPELADMMPMDAPGVVYGGLTVIYPEIVERFTQHMLIVGQDPVGGWVGNMQRATLPYGSSTGTLSLAEALVLTTGRCYLVGHDLAYDNGVSHWDRASKAANYGNDQIEGHDGQMLQTWSWYKTFANQFSMYAAQTGRVVNVNGHYRRGARIRNAISAPLPRYEDCDPISWRLPPQTSESMAFGMDLLNRARRLPSDLRRAVRKIAAATDKDDLHHSKLLPGDNQHAYFSLLQPVYTAFNMEHVLGVKPDFGMQKQVLTNVIEGCIPRIEEAVAYAEST